MKDNVTEIIKTPATVSYNCDETLLTIEAKPSKLITPNNVTDHNDSKRKKKRKNKSDLGAHFVAPDRGWGWFVAIASGVSILVTFALSQQFGIIFRDHMSKLGITSSQLTSIINIQIAVTSISGLLNGPLFRRFSFRQVALFGSFLTFLGLFACAFANSFLFYCLSYSCCYGFGRRLTVSASSLAVNTYFKERRRTATAYQFAVAGLGPIFLPYLATFLIENWGVEGTVLFFAGLSLNTVACSLIYQPVKWHVKTKAGDAETLKTLTSLVDGQPALSQGNDYRFGSKNSLNSASKRNRLTSSDETQESSKSLELKLLRSVESSNSSSAKADNNQDNENNKLQMLEDNERETEIADALIEEKNEMHKKLHWYTKVVVFFELDLLKDFSFLNLAFGLTLINFVELNFAILTPFILSDFGFGKEQIALAMSLLGVCDLVLRFLIPLITININLSNKTFFIMGILGMCIGRIFLSFTRNYHVLIGIFIWLGLNKAFRTVFWALIIPGYVPLKRLPAAAGLQLLFSGLFSLAVGPLIGLIRDRTNYSFALNFLNVLGLLAIGSWILEAFVRKYIKKL